MRVSYSFSLQGITQIIMRKLLEILFQSASLVIDTIRTFFFLIVLSILGPIAFALSVFDGLQNTLVQWLARYISVYLWLPVSDLFGAMLAKIQTLILQEEMNLMANPMSIIDVDGSSAIYLIFMIIGLVGYFCVPTVSNWIVQAGGMSAYNRNVNNTASKVTNVAGATAGASTGNVAAVLLKSRNVKNTRIMEFKSLKISNPRSGRYACSRWSFWVFAHRSRRMPSESPTCSLTGSGRRCMCWIRASH